MITNLLSIRVRAGASLAVLAAALATPAFAAPAPEDAPPAAPVAGPSISGHVYDATGAALPGARIVVEETGEEASTNLQGAFTIAAPDADGPATLLIDYLGRAPQSRTVTAAERGRAVEIVLPAAGADQGDIVVTGASLLDNTARALNQQRQADNTITVISADAIGRFPDPNIAEALQRAPGIGIERDQGEGRYINVRGAPSEWSAISVDGVPIGSVDPTTRAVDLDTLPSDIVANLEVTKSLLPYQDADSISGAVNITTRSAFDRRGFALTGMAGGSYNQFGGTSDWRGSAAVSDRFGGDRQFGVLLSGSYSRTHRRPDNVENGWAFVPDPANPNGPQLLRVTETLFKDYDTRRERIAGTGALEWRPADAVRMWLRGSYARFEDNEYRDQLLLLWGEGTLRPGSTETSATWDRTRIDKQARHRVQVNQIWSAAQGAEFQLGDGLLRYDLAYSRSQQRYPRRDELLFRSSLRPTMRYDIDPEGDRSRYSVFETGEHLQVDRFAFRENAYRASTTDNEEFSGGLRMDIPTRIGTSDVTLSFGGKYRQRDIAADEERLRDRRAGASPGALGGLLIDEPSRNFDFDLGRRFSPDLTDAYYDRTKSLSQRRIPQSITADYAVTEKVMGMFGMARIELPQTRIVVGLRAENTDFRGEAPTFIVETETQGLARARSNYFELFPNLTLRHAFTPSLIGRFALWRGINRPNFPDVVPTVTDNTDSDVTGSDGRRIIRVTQGNPALPPALANNVDAGIEYYIRPLGLVSANAFYKDVRDFRYTVTRTGTYLGEPGAQLTRPENAPDGHLYGIELNWQQQFGFLPGILGGLGVFANYTYTEAEITLAQPYGGRSVMPLPGQSKHMWNASLFYEQGPVNLRVAYTTRSDYLNEVNADAPALDLYWEGRGQLDVTASYQLTPEVNLFFEGKNLTNSAGVRYYGERSRLYEFEKFGYTLFGGVRVKL
jgi:TonB-dependent receptor